MAVCCLIRNKIGLTQSNRHLTNPDTRSRTSGLFQPYDQKNQTCAYVQAQSSKMVTFLGYELSAKQLNAGRRRCADFQTAGTQEHLQHHRVSGDYPSQGRKCSHAPSDDAWRALKKLIFIFIVPPHCQPVTAGGALVVFLFNPPKRRKSLC